MADKKSANKTTETRASVSEFINGVTNPTRRADGFALLELMTRVSGEAPSLWGPSIIGFGRYHYRYDSGREGDMLLMGFSPRKANLVLYLERDADEDAALLARLGKYKTGVACLYVNKLADVDRQALEALVAACWKRASAKPRDRRGG